MKTRLAIATVLFLGAGAGLALAEDAQTVLSDIHKDNQMEIRMGKLAQEKGQSADVRSFGERLVKDHQDADDKVKTLAEKQGIVLEPSNKIMQTMRDHDIDT